MAGSSSARVVIDLCTPPPSPARGGAENVPPHAAAVNSEGTALGKRKATELTAAHLVNTYESDESEEDVEVVERAARAAAAPSAAADNEEADDGDELTFVGRSGNIALADFPHSREHCATHKFGAGRDHEHCANCYCYVCDDQAAKCPSWSEHCRAAHAQPYWQQQRRAWATKKAAPAPAPPASSSTSSWSNSAAHSNWARKLSDGDAWSCEELLRNVQQVYPVEVGEPRGLLSSVRLRPYQKQSLAFMLDIERSTDTSLCGTTTHKTGTQSVRGGWLCDEMGMGKTVVAISLILANPSTEPAVSDAEWQRALSLGRQPEWQIGNNYNLYQRKSDEWKARVEAYSPVPLKVTLIIAPNTLLGQWKDELTKYAPGLRVETYHGSDSDKKRAIKNMRIADVILMTPAMYCMPRPGGIRLDERKAAYSVPFPFIVHRVIIDECHLAVYACQQHITKLYRTPHLWALTGTPISQHQKELTMMFILMGCPQAIPGYPQSRRRGPEFAAQLRKLMIRRGACDGSAPAPRPPPTPTVTRHATDTSPAGTPRASASAATLRLPSQTRTPPPSGSICAARSERSTRRGHPP